MKKNEDKLQKECYVWFHNNYPELRNLLCYNLNNSKDAIAGARDRAMGLTKGRCDMVFYYNSTATMIEFKTETGRQTADQKEWQKDIENQGFTYVIVRNLKDFKKIILKKF